MPLGESSSCISSGCVISSPLSISRLSTSNFHSKTEMGCYCAQHGLPTFTDYYFLDVFCSVRSPAGSLLIVNALMIASRQRSRKPPGLCAVAINERSLKTFKKLNFNIHEFKSHGQKRHLCWIRIDEFKLEPLLARLKFANNEYLVRNICFRKGATAASEHKVMKNGC